MQDKHIDLGKIDVETGLEGSVHLLLTKIRTCAQIWHSPILERSTIIHEEEYDLKHLKIIL